jgi:hypothetical protein
MRERRGHRRGLLAVYETRSGRVQDFSRPSFSSHSILRASGAEPGGQRSRGPWLPARPRSFRQSSMRELQRRPVCHSAAWRSSRMAWVSNRVFNWAKPSRISRSRLSFTSVIKTARSCSEIIRPVLHNFELALLFGFGRSEAWLAPNAASIHGGASQSSIFNRV